MKHHEFTPEPEVLAARILAQAATIEAVRSAEPGAVDAPHREMRGQPPAEVPATLEALTALRDRAFVEAAYRLLLGREADPAGQIGRASCRERVWDSVGAGSWTKN